MPSNGPSQRAAGRESNWIRSRLLHSIGIFVEAAKGAFDRERASQFPASELKTYAEALAQYHLRPEAKFLNGDFCDRGRTERRHVVATQLVHIGKEANKWEEQHFLGEDEDAEIEYGVEESAGWLDAAIRKLTDELGERDAATAIGISRTALRRALRFGSKEVSNSVRLQLAGVDTQRICHSRWVHGKRWPRIDGDGIMTRCFHREPNPQKHEDPPRSVGRFPGESGKVTKRRL